MNATTFAAPAAETAPAATRGDDAAERRDRIEAEVRAAACEPGW